MAILQSQSGAGDYRRVRIVPWIYIAALLHVPALSAPAHVHGAPIHYVQIDGLFDDWLTVPSHGDPPDDQHDTDHDGQFDTPSHVEHPDVDILEYKFAHDDQNLYAYFRATGEIGATQDESAGNGRAGRYYVIVTIDVDNDDSTGYWIHEGGYYPTSRGYDMNMEVEYYDGAFNTGHYINHGALSEADIPTLEAQQKQGIVDVLPGTYDHYTQWVMFEDPVSGDHDLGDGTSITFVADKGPVYQGNITAALSPDGRQLEMVAPFIGFMSYPGQDPGERGDPIMRLGRTIDISFSLEASGELQTPPGDNGQWASDTAEPIVGYSLDSIVLGDMDTDGDIDFDDIDDFVLGLNDPATYAGLYGAPPATYGDADSDGNLDFDDIAGFVTLLNGPLATPAHHVPEPSTLALLAIALLAVPLRRIATCSVVSCYPLDGQTRSLPSRGSGSNRRRNRAMGSPTSMGYSAAALLAAIPLFALESQSLSAEPTCSAAEPTSPRDGRFRPLTDIVTSTVAPSSWADVGGTGSIESFDHFGLMVISQTQEVHTQIENLITTRVYAVEDLAVPVTFRVRR